MTILADPDKLFRFAHGQPEPEELAQPPKTVTERCKNDARFEVQGYNVCAGHRAKILRGENLRHG